VHGTTKLARRVLVPVDAKVVLEAMDEPKRLHRKQQASQEKPDETAALEHGIETGADGRRRVCHTVRGAWGTDYNQASCRPPESRNEDKKGRETQWKETALSGPS
jgi:hypothetical protein